MLRPVDDDLQRRLAAVLEPASRAQLPAWIAAYLAENAEPDADHLVQTLWESRRISEIEHLRACLVQGAPVLGALGERVHPGLRTVGEHALIGRVGHGGMADVHAARDQVLQRKVAYKILKGGGDRAEEAARRFVREAQLTAQLAHPAIIPVYSLRRHADGALAYTMKLVEGRTLSLALAEALEAHRAGALVDEPHELAVRLEQFVRVCEAVSHAHSLGVLHRDLKPANIMLGAHREVYVLDWGIATVLARPEEDPDLQDVAIGTPKYMSPEQARGETDQLGPASDQYALGLILQEIVTLGPATPGATSLASMIHASQAERNPMVHAVAHLEIPRELVAIVGKATAPAAADRYADVDAFAEDIRRFLRGSATRALPDSPFGRVARWLARHRNTAIASSLAVILLTSTMAVAAIALALEASVVAQRREIALTAALTHGERVANAVDAELAAYGRLVEAVSAAATIVVAHGATGAPVTELDAFADPARAPRDLRDAPAFGRPISLSTPGFLVPYGLDDPRAEKLALLAEDLRRTLLRSGLSGRLDLTPEREWQALGVDGVPARRIRIALNNGLQLSYPGDASPQGDPRATNWYQVAAGRRFLHWGRARVVDGAVRVHCSRSVFAEGDLEFVGVADIDFQLGPDLLADVEGDAWLIDGDGRILASTEGPGTLELHPWDTALSLAAMDGTRFLDVDGGLIVLSPVPSTGWSLITRR